MRIYRFLFALLSLASLGAALSAQTAAPAVSTTAPEIAELQKTEDAWSQAIHKQDQFALENVLSSVYMDIASSGEISTRDQIIALLVSRTLNIEALEQKIVTVRLLNGAAIANGTYSLHRKTATGSVEEKGVFTHIFQRSHAGWVCIQSQRTPLHEQTLNKPGKKSNAESPFHIPLFTH